MKKAILFAGALVAGLVFYSCSNEEGVAMDQTEAISIQAPISSTAKLGDQSVLFTYATTAEAANRSKSAVLALQSDLQSEMKLRKGCTRVLANVKISGGQGRLLSFQFIDDNKKLILETHTLNPATGQYTVSNGGTPAEELGYCPDGYSSLANCPHFLSDGDFANCLGSAQQQYTQQNLTGVGSCIEIRVQVGTAATSMCGRTC